MTVTGKDFASPVDLHPVAPLPNGYSVPESDPPLPPEHAFEPDDSPEEKKQQALGAASGNLARIDTAMEALKPSAASELQSDLNGHPVEPSVTIQDIKATSAAVSSTCNKNTELGGLPGQLSASPASTDGGIPDWYKVGWAAQIDPAGNGEASLEVRQKDVLETFLSEMYYGAWYHNAAIIFFAVAASHYVTIFGGGWSSLIIILSICATYYQTSIRRVRRDARGDVARELAKQRLFQDHETVDWLNNFLHRFWLIYEPVLSATIVASVDQILVSSTPSFLESIRMSTFTLGSKAPRIDFIRSHPETEDDVVVMDWKFDFTPNDILDMTAKAAASKINPKIVLTIKFGKGLIGAAKDIVVENIMFCGTMRIRIKLMNNFPHLQLIDLSFMEKPEFDFVLKPVGFDLNMIPGLSGFIESQVHATLGPMMYDPNVFTLNLEQMLAGTPTDTAIGVLQLTIRHARGLKAVKIGGGVPDPYVTISIGAHTGLGKTKIKHSTQNPNWNSTHFLLLNSLNELLALEIMDYNEVRKDTSLGTANIDLQTLLAEPEQEGLMIPIMQHSKARGEIQVDLTYHPCLTPRKLESGEEEPAPDTTTGVVRVTLHQAKELDYKRTGTSHLSPYGQIFLNGLQVQKTPVIKRTNNPVFEVYTEVLVLKKLSAVFTVKILDDRLGENPTIGHVNVKLTDLLEATSGEHKNDWFPLVGGKTGKVRMSATWKGVLMAGAINGARAYVPPIGVLKFWFKRAEDLKNVEALTGGKSDPYVRIMRSGIVLSRTHIHNNNLDPEFDEILYVPVHNLKEIFRLEVMDYQHTTKDRSLGITDLSVQDFLTPCKPKGLTTHQSTGKRTFSEYLKTDGKKAVVKGRLHFDVEFYPCTYMKFPPFDEPTSDLDKVKKNSDEAASNMASAVESKLEDAGSFVNGDSSKTGDRLEVLASPLTADAAPQSTVLEAGSAKTGSLYSRHSSSGTLGEPASAVSVVSEVSDAKPVEISKEDLLQAQSGILIFNIMGGTVAKKNARLEFLFDDGYWPAYSTEPSKSVNAKWDETGESFIRELDWSRCMLKLNLAEKETREEVYAQFSCSLKNFLEDCLDGPHNFVLEDEEGGHRSSVTIQCRYIPVPITLEPRESVNNMGILTVMLDTAKDLIAADRNGYSDPYAQFVLNGVKVFKSNVQKKTLNPKWMERFNVEIVFDWDRVGASDKLGEAQINLKELEPMLQSSMALKLTQDGKQQGVVHVKMTFRPEFITRSRQATSTFTGLGRVATGLGGTVLSTGAGVGIGAVKGVGQVGGGVIKGVGGVGRLGFSGIRKVTGAGHKRNDTAESETLESSSLMGTPPRASMSVPPLPSNSSLVQPTPTKVVAADLWLTLTNIGASGLESPDVRAYVCIKRNGKAVLETKPVRHTTSPVWEETCMIDVAQGASCLLELIVYDKKKLGKDKELGSLIIDPWQHILPQTARYEAEIMEALSNGSGEMRLKLSATVKPSESPKPHGRTRGSSFLEMDPTELNHGPPSPGGKSQKSVSRFSLHRNR